MMWFVQDLASRHSRHGMRTFLAILVVQMLCNEFERRNTSLTRSRRHLADTADNLMSISLPKHLLVLYASRQPNLAPG